MILNAVVYNEVLEIASSRQVEHLNVLITGKWSDLITQNQKLTLESTIPRSCISPDSILQLKLIQMVLFY